MHTEEVPSKVQVTATSGQPDQAETLSKLRTLLLGEQKSRAIDEFTEASQVSRVAQVLADAVRENVSSGNRLGDELAPVIDRALTEAIARDPERIATAIYPIIGPAIRMVIAAALEDMVQTLNTAIEGALQPKRLLWRAQAWGSGQSYGEFVLLRTMQYRSEQAFFIHRDSGLLLAHAHLEDIQSQDPELVSGMLSAINSFVRQSFSDPNSTVLASTPEASVQEIRYDDLRLIVLIGRQALLACAVRGHPDQELKQLLRDVLKDFHRTFRVQLKGQVFDSEHFEPAVPLLRSCLQTRAAEAKKRKPWPALFLLAALLSVGSFFLYRSVQDHIVAEVVIDTFKAEPGYQLISSANKDGSLQLLLLKDPESRAATEVLEEASSAALATRWPLRRMPQVDTAVTVVDFDPQPVAPMIVAPAPPPRPPTIADLSADISAVHINFAPASAELDDAARNELDAVVSNFARMDAMAAADSQPAVLLVSGYADASGSRALNLAVSTQRAAAAGEYLRAAGLTDERIVETGMGGIETTAISPDLQRFVTIQVMQ